MCKTHKAWQSSIYNLLKVKGVIIIRIKVFIFVVGGRKELLNNSYWIKLDRISKFREKAEEMEN